MLQSSQRKSLRRSKKVYYQIKELLLQKKKSISESVYAEFKDLLLKLNEAILNKDRESAYAHRTELIKLSGEKLKKNLWDLFREWVLGIGVILLLVATINQTWFQLYEIPSGSMRPTFLEKDRLIATKTNFGINFPFKKGHLYFNPNQLHRGNAVILQNDNLPKSENRSRYLFLFPAQKQFVKRLIGKPGDVLYFYGGKVYGVDKNNEEITEFHTSEAFKPLEHVPFNSFEGKVLSEAPREANQIHSPVYLYQMDQLIGKLYLGPSGSFQGKFYNGSRWVDESPRLSYQDLWGIKNYGMTRLLTKDQALAMGAPTDRLSEDYVLEISHAPHLNFPKPHLGMDLEGRLRPKLSLEKSYLPVSPRHLEKIKSALYSARFVIKDGFASNYSMERGFRKSAYSPSFKGVPNGTYEFIEGKGYRVTKMGRQVPLSDDHPLNSHSPELIQKLYNLGMQMLTLYEPTLSHYDFLPARYTYYRNGDLYLMGQPIFEKADPSLEAFVKAESSKSRSFIDPGPPILPNGKLDKDLILNYGLAVPRGHYLCLGDNHAGSRDCRSWGFIPEKNIQGSPSVILWPLSKRVGTIRQNGLTWLNGPTLFITLLGLTLIFGSSYFSRRERRKPL